MNGDRPVMGNADDAGTIPGWTLVVGLLAWVVPTMILEACRDFGLSWWIGVPTAIAVIVAWSFAERAIDRKYRT